MKPKGELTYVTRLEGKPLIWRISQPYEGGAWYATLTDAVPGPLEQPEINRWQLVDLLNTLDEFRFQAKHVGVDYDINVDPDFPTEEQQRMRDEHK